MPPTTPPKALLFDIGGVCVRFFPFPSHSRLRTRQPHPGRLDKLQHIAGSALRRLAADRAGRMHPERRVLRHLQDRARGRISLARIPEQAPGERGEADRRAASASADQREGAVLEHDAHIPHP